MEVDRGAGAGVLRTDDQGFEIVTEPAAFEKIHRAIEAQGIKCAGAEVTSLALLTVPVAEPAAVTAVNRLMELLEDHDDVKEIHSNAEFTE